MARNWLLDLPIRTKLALLIGLLGIDLAAVITVSIFGMTMLSSVRAYVGGEGLWAKAQKNAIYSLSKYAFFHNEADYQDYLRALQTPLGDRQARQELAKPALDYRAAREGFIAGQNHPEDIGGMIFLFRRFHGLPHISRAIQIWGQADTVMVDLQKLGEELHALISSGRGSREEIGALIGRLDGLNGALTGLENDFSFTMGQAARWARQFLLWTMVLSFLAIGGFTFSAAFLISRAIAQEVSGISRAASQLAEGDLSVRAPVVAGDELGRLSEVFNHMAGELARIDQLKNDFLSMVSHELRTPLTLMLAPVESLLAGDYGTLSEAQGNMLKVAQNNSVRLLQMVNGLLDFSKLEAGKVEVRRQPTEIATLTRAICGDFDPILAGRGIRASIQTQPEEAWVQMDRYLYERILFNLLSNAVKFTPQGGRIAVEVRWEKDCLTLAVEDTGMGIPESEMPRLFQKFRQLDTSSTRRFEGTGLGLALVKEFSALLEGEVSCRSEVGKGSRFTVVCRAPAAEAAPGNGGERRVPKRLAQESAADLRNATAAPTDRRRMPRVLIAEDNREMAGYLADILMGFCDPIIAADGESAWEWVRRRMPDLVISDVMMPRKDGLSLCREIKAYAPTASIPVVLLTALTDRESMMKGWEAGADDYLFKPFHPKEVATRVRTLLAAAQERRKVRELELSNSELEQFAHVVSHDLQEPLRMVSSYVQLLRKRYEGKLDREADEFIHYAVDGAVRMQALIQDLLKYSSVSLSKETPATTDLKAALDQALENLKLAVSESGATVTHDALPVVPAYATQMAELLQNLIGNALKFRGERPPVIHVGAERQPGQWLLSVRDNGIGIAPEYHAQIFNIFQRLHTHERYPGTGIGLSVCKRIVERHGGRVWVESESGKGATFFFTLPDAPEGKT